ncbi:hypothetical protein [Mycobacterium sp. IS-836]|uniref:hypothetical protein n=1 Tax=Mycobacterium sp. IS-836 TaxID=1834160 RepID=UPI00114F2B2D|nr:hypothetical protein [Mycobacterium sp. IS-836]
MHNFDLDRKTRFELQHVISLLTALTGRRIRYLYAPTLGLKTAKMFFRVLAHGGNIKRCYTGVQPEMKGHPMNAKSSKRRMLKAGAAAVALVAVMLGSTGCTITGCSGSIPGTVTCA